MDRTEDGRRCFDGLRGEVALPFVHVHVKVIVNVNEVRDRVVFEHVYVPGAVGTEGLGDPAIASVHLALPRIRREINVVEYYSEDPCMNGEESAPRFLCILAPSHL